MQYKLLRDAEMLKHKLLAHSYGSHGADLNSLFDHIDRNHSGVIEREDMIVMIRDIVPNVNQFELDTFLAIMDHSEKGYVTREEFIEFVKDRQSLHETDKYEDAIRKFTDCMELTGIASPQPVPIAVTPAQQAASTAKLSKPLDRHMWKGISEKGPDYRVTTCHKGRQRPGYKHPILHRKEKMEKEFGLGYSDPEKDAWDELREQMIVESSKAHLLTSASSASFHQPSSSSARREEVPASVIWTDSKVQKQHKKPKKFKVSLSEFDGWLEKNKEWSEKAKEHSVINAEKVQCEKGVVPPAFMAKQTPKLASKAYERYRQAISGFVNDENGHSVLNKNSNDISVLTAEIAEGNIDVGDNIKELLAVIPFEVLPVHERLNLEAKYYASRNKEKADHLANNYKPPKVLRRSKQILFNTPRKSLVDREDELLKANNSIRLDSPRTNQSSSDAQLPISIDISDLASSLSASDLSAVRQMMRSGSDDRSDRREKSGFGFTSPRFLNASASPGRNPDVMWGLAEQSAQISWKPADACTPVNEKTPSIQSHSEQHKKKAYLHTYANEKSNEMVHESFQDRLTRSVSAHHARKSYKAEMEYRRFGNPGPGHYELPTDPIKCIKRKEGTTQNTQKVSRSMSASSRRNFEVTSKNLVRSRSPGVSIGNAARECNEAYKRIPTSAKIASMIKTAVHAPKMTAKQKYEHDMAVHKAVVTSHQNSGMVNTTRKDKSSGDITALVVAKQEESKLDNVEGNSDDALRANESLIS